jgi:protein-S-isoprenylcysteine O-methyltransferase Ste14
LIADSNIIKNNMNTIAPIIYIGWLIAEIALARITKARQADRSEDRNSLRFLWITIALSCTIGGILSSTLYFPLSQGIYLKYAGLGILVAGIIIRVIAIMQLGRFFTVDVAIRKDHRIIDTGLYRRLRHPSYTGALLSFLGLGIFLNNCLALPVIVIPVTIAFIRRMQIEEAALKKEFGEDYDRYQERTWRLLPWIY